MAAGLPIIAMVPEALHGVRYGREAFHFDPADTRQPLSQGLN
jgi:hypothetical protein